MRFSGTVSTPYRETSARLRKRGGETGVGLFRGGIGGQNPPDRRPGQIQATGDLGLAESGAVEFPDWTGVEAHREGGQVVCPVARFSKSRTHAFRQQIAFELGVLQFSPIRRTSKDGQPWRDRWQWACPALRWATGTNFDRFFECGDQVRQRAAPSIQTPHQHSVDLTAACGVDQVLPELSLGGACAELCVLVPK